MSLETYVDILNAIRNVCRHIECHKKCNVDILNVTGNICGYIECH